MLTRPNLKIKWNSLSAPYLLTVTGLLATLILINLPPSSWYSGITHNYLSLHIMLEFIGILVSFAIFTVGWATYQNARDADILILSVASCAIGLLDMGHTLTFTGMPEFFGDSGPNKAIAFWLASRFTGSLAFVYVALSEPRQARLRFLHWLLLVIALIWVSFCFWIVLCHLDWLPTFFIPGQGLTQTKIILEISLILISWLAGLLFFLRAARRENMSTRWMGAASALYGMCGCFFTRYQTFDDLDNFLGHVFKAICYLVLYRAVFIECVSKPFDRVAALAKEAAAANAGKSRFLANVSHEFRTPLGVISGFSELMLSSGQLDATLSTWAQTITKNAKQLNLLIDDLLDLAKAETDKIEIRLSRFDVAALLLQTSEALELQGRSKQVSVTFRTSLQGAVWVVSDELRLRQIIINIVGNAVKFTLQGHVHVHLEALPENGFEILVEDSGIGIAEKDIPGLFQPFAQVSNPERRQFGGTGLGLSLSKKLTELLGGSLSLKSSKVGEGSLFRITFRDRVESPLHEVQVEKPLPVLKSSKIGAPQFQDKKILVAEDSLDNQMLLKNYLKATGVTIVFAGNGAEAVAKYKIDRFDLVLMDIQMPVMDGFEATQALRAEGWRGPVVALTAHAYQPERERAMNTGFDDYLIKPIDKEQLWFSLSEGFARPPRPS